jgi:two-component system, OmpR family, KDP operon response regulator KdpE
MTEAADPATVLLVEDDRSLSLALIATLKAAGYRPVSAGTAAEGLRWFAHYAPDLVLLDLGLPDRDGLSVIREIRQRGPTPIVVLVEELLARVRAGLRHGVPVRGATPAVRVGDVEIDLGLRTVKRRGEPVKLTPKEYDVLCELALNGGRAVSHGQLLRAAWGSEKADVQYLRVYVGYLRHKLGEALFESVPGVGYRLVID